MENTIVKDAYLCNVEMIKNNKKKSWLLKLNELAKDKLHILTITRMSLVSIPTIIKIYRKMKSIFEAISKWRQTHKKMTQADNETNSERTLGLNKRLHTKII